MRKKKMIINRYSKKLVKIVLQTVKFDAPPLQKEALPTM